MRALRHHAARTRALAEQVREARPVDGMRAWFRSFFGVLRARAGGRHFSLRTLLYRPSSPLRKLAAPASGALAAATPRSRQPRRMAQSGSAGWFGFAAR